MGERQRPPAQARFQAKVHGRVQGVAFRFHTRQHARELGLTGTVRNLWDGSVEVVAEGPRRELERLLAYLRVGPQGARVTHVDVEWQPPATGFDRFEVIP